MAETLSWFPYVHDDKSLQLRSLILQSASTTVVSVPHCGIVGIDRAVAVIVEPVAFAFGLPRMDEFWTIRIAHVFIVATIIGDELFFANFVDDFFTNCIPIAIFVLFGIGYAIAIEVEIGAVDVANVVVARHHHAYALASPSIIAINPLFAFEYTRSTFAPIDFLGSTKITLHRVAWGAYTFAIRVANAIAIAVVIALGACAFAIDALRVFIAGIVASAAMRVRRLQIDAFARVGFGRRIPRIARITRVPRISRISRVPSVPRAIVWVIGVCRVVCILRRRFLPRIVTTSPNTNAQSHQASKLRQIVENDASEPPHPNR